MQTRNLMLATSALVLCMAASASAQPMPSCNVNASSCSISSQSMGDTVQNTDANNYGPSTTTQVGNSTGSVASGAEQNLNIGDTMTSSGAATTTTGAVTGGGATGNLSNNDNDNRSSASTGAIDASSGASTATTGPVNAVTGPATATGVNQMGDMTGTVSGTQNARTGDNNGTISGRTGDNSADIRGTNTGTNLSNVEVAPDIRANNDVSQGQATLVGNTSDTASASSLDGNTLSNTAAGGTAAQKQAQANTLTDTGNSQSLTDVNIDSSNHSNYKAIFIPAVVPVTPPSTVAIGNIIKETTSCGPLQAVIRTPVTGTFNGLFRSSQIAQGFTYDLAPYVDANGVMQTSMEVVGADGVRRVYGHQAIIFSTVLGLASNRNIAIGGGGNDGAWGQGGLGSSSSNTQLVTNIQLKLCELGHFQPQPETVIVEVPPKPIRQ